MELSSVDISLQQLRIPQPSPRGEAEPKTVVLESMRPVRLAAGELGIPNSSSIWPRREYRRCVFTVHRGSFRLPPKRRRLYTWPTHSFITLYASHSRSSCNLHTFDPGHSHQKQRISSNMSNSSPSDNSGSVAVGGSSRVPAIPSRPPHKRDHSYTHVFPASSAGRKTCEQADQPRARKPEASFAPTKSLNEYDNTRLLYGGLQWLLDASTQSPESSLLHNKRDPPAPLSEDAIKSFNASKTGGQNAFSEPAQTAAWVDRQIKSPAAPPF